ncbi:MAG: DNA polymerase III subunit alpha [Candidatus Komeilibacteria bacterium]
MEFTHLHVHSHFSLLDGLGKIDQLISRAKDLNMTALALTDHGVMYGAIEFYQKCLKAGIKPIIGMEAYLANESIQDQPSRERPYHLTLLAKNKTGYKNLLQLTSIAHLQGFYYKPRIDWQLLEQYSDGLIALSGCLNGPLARHLAQNDDQQAELNLQKIVKIFGSDNFYLEMQNRPTMPEQSLVNSGLIRLSKKHRLPLVATNDVHYARSEDSLAHDILICLQTKSKITDKDRLSYIGEDYSLLSAEDMGANFTNTPEAISNTAAIAERCNLEIELGKINLPEFEVPNGLTPEDYLRQLTYQGLPARYQTSYETAPQELKDRLDYELDIISKTGFAAYFLIVQDFVNWAKKNGIVVGPGRGSAAGSIVSYLLNITNVDPITYKLLFERFLNPERVSMPDIDMDFADVRREEVLKYVETKYGHDRVAQIITFGTMAARAAIRDVGRVLDFGYSYCDRIAKLIPLMSTLSDALAKVKELQEVYQEDEQAKRLIDAARQLEGVARHASTHACAVLITKDALVNYVPLQYSSSDDTSIISQYSMHPVEDLGLLKMDFLGLKNLTIIENALDIIRATTGTEIKLDAIPLDDPTTFQLLQRGDTRGIFQLESSGMTRYLKQLKPTSIEDIIAMISLYRPGPMEFIEEYIGGKHGTRKITYLHPELEPILANTYGIAVYQEQIMEIARKLAGFTYGQADILRKAVGKKIKKLLDEQEELLIKGMVTNNIPAETAQKIWDFIVPFARYGFNRSHAASYAMISFHTAYLKAHFPAQFMAALLTADLHDIETVSKEVNDCSAMGLAVLPPDVNESFSTFSVVMNPDKPQEKPRTLRFGLNAIKNVGEHISKAIVRERKTNGFYQTLENFLQRVTDKDLNKKSLESLIKAGALDAFGERGQMLANLETLLTFNKKSHNDGKVGITNLFADLPIKINARLKLEPAPATDNWQRLAWEKELLGLYVSDHPFKPYLTWLKEAIVPLRDLKKHDGRGVTVAGVVTNVHKVVTKAGDPMLFITIEDSTASPEVIIFPKLLQSTAIAWRNSLLVMVEGKVSDKDGVPKIIADSVKELTEETLQKYQQSRLRDLKVWLTLPANFAREKLTAIKEICQQHQGPVPVYLVIQNHETRKVRTNLHVTASQELQSALEQLVGAGSWKLEERA